MCLRITFISIPTFRYATSNDEVTVGRNKCYKCCRSTAPYQAAVIVYCCYILYIFFPLSVTYPLKITFRIWSSSKNNGTFYVLFALFYLRVCLLQVFFKQQRQELSLQLFSFPWHLHEGPGNCCKCCKWSRELSFALSSALHPHSLLSVSLIQRI